LPSAPRHQAALIGLTVSAIVFIAACAFPLLEKWPQRGVDHRRRLQDGVEEVEELLDLAAFASEDSPYAAIPFHDARSSTAISAPGPSRNPLMPPPVR